MEFVVSICQSSWQTTNIRCLPWAFAVTHDKGAWPGTWGRLCREPWIWHTAKFESLSWVTSIAHSKATSPGATSWNLCREPWIWLMANTSILLWARRQAHRKPCRHHRPCAVTMPLLYATIVWGFAVSRPWLTANVCRDPEVRLTVKDPFVVRAWSRATIGKLFAESILTFAECRHR